MLSSYFGSNRLVDSHTPLLAMRNALPNAAVAYAVGCDVFCNTTSGFSEAIDLAKSSDVSVVFLGLDESQEREGFDRTTLELPGHQLQLL